MDRYCDMDPNVTTRYLEVDVGQLHAAIMMDGTIFIIYSVRQVSR